MRTMMLILIAVSLLALVPASEAAPPSGGGCQVQEEYVTESSLGEFDPSNPTANPVEPGAHRPIECYY